MAGRDGGRRPSSAVSLTLLANMLLVDASINSTLWALQLEVLTVPVILVCYFLERSYGAGPLIAAVIVATILSFTKRWTFWPPLSHHLFAFLVGMLIPTVGAALVAKLPRAAAQKALIASAFTLIATGQILGFYSQFSTIAETYAAAALICLVTYRRDLTGPAFLDFAVIAPDRALLGQLLRAAHAPAVVLRGRRRLAGAAVVERDDAAPCGNPGGRNIPSRVCSAHVGELPSDRKARYCARQMDQ